MIKNFYLPGYYGFQLYIFTFLWYKDKHLEYFIPDRNIAGAYDLPLGLKWNGGRSHQYITMPKYNMQYTEKIINSYHKIKNFSLLHTCTNFYANELLDDIDCNNFIKQFYQPQDKVIIANEQLHSYLKNLYPEMSFVYSTTLNIKAIDKINEITANNDYVLHYSKNADNNYLKQLLYPENIEILCAEACSPNCPYRQKHYDAISKANLGDTSNAQKYIDKCPFKEEEKKNKNTFEMIERYDWRINNTRINELSNMGFNKFKLCGRTWSPKAFIQMLIYYLVKPVYWNIVESDLNKLFLIK